jgi:Tol biopolymer transport system component
MSEFRTILEQTKKRFPAPELPLEGVLRVRDRRRRNQRLVAGAVALGVMLAAILFGTSVLRSGEETPGQQAHHPTPNGLIALSNGTYPLTLFDPKTGNSSGLSLRLSKGETGNHAVSALTWSPDGTRFAYSASEEGGPVRLYDLETNAISTIVPCEPDGAPCASGVAWSPDGSRIALSYGGLDLVDPDGSKRTTLIDAGQGLGVGNVTWSPGGDTIAFTGPHNAVYEVDADGSNIRILFDLSGSGNVRDLSWSPDGSRIAYLLFDPQTPVGGPGTPSYTASIPQVWIVNADGSQPSMLFEGGECCGLYDWTGLSWSGDGTKIAFVAPRAADPSASGLPSDDSDTRLYEIDADDGSVQELARYVCLCGAPEWQPAP